MNTRDRAKLIKQIEQLTRELAGDGITHAANFRIASSIVKKPCELKKNLCNPELKKIYQSLEDHISASASRYKQIAKLLSDAALTLALLRTESTSADGIFDEWHVKKLRDVNKRREQPRQRWTPAETFHCSQ